MKIDASTIIGFLSGSLATIILKFILDQITNKQVFNREIAKIIFTKKLQIAENAVAYYYAFLSKIIELQKSLELTVKVLNDIEKTDKDLAAIMEIIQKNGSFISELSSEKYTHINAVHLYFDFNENDKLHETNLEKTLEILADIGDINNEILYWNQLENEAIKEEKSQDIQFYWEQILKCIPRYVSQINNFISSLEESKKSIKILIHIIKKNAKYYNL
jgi:hypothetical protein